MKILLTGASGQLGIELHRSLAGLGEVVAPDRSELDLADLDQVSMVIRSLRPDLIVNAAAYTAVDRAESDSALAHRINAEAPARIAAEAVQLGSMLVHFSSDYVFDGAKGSAYGEADLPNPVNVYGHSKLAGERAIADAGGRYLIVRTSWLYSMHGSNFLLTMLRLARENRHLRVVADQHGAPTSTRVVAHALMPLLEQARQGGEAWWRDNGGLHHLACTGSTSWHGFATAIMSNAGLNCAVDPITSAQYPTPARRPRDSTLSSQHFAARYCSIPDWETALSQCLARRT